MEKREIFRIENNQEVKIEFSELRKGDKFRVIDTVFGEEIRNYICIAKCDSYMKYNALLDKVILTINVE